MTRRCPVCKSAENEFITKLCSNMGIMGEHFKDAESYLVCCKKCGLVYSNIEASQEDFNKYYTSPNCCPLSYEELYGKENSEKYFMEILEKFEHLINYDSQIIDVASGTGDFALFLQNKGYKNVYALDINEKAVESAKSKGLKTILSDTMNIPQELENKFDIAILGHSLEHYLDIDKVLLNIKKILKPYGYLYIEVPDAEKYSDTDSVPFTMFTYEHLYHFTLNTMDNIAKAFGYKLTDKNQFFKAASYDVLYALYQNNGTFEPVVYDATCKNGIKKYIEHCKKELVPHISKFEKSQEKLILWGIGASTALLLNGTFSNCNVIQLIDRSKARQGLAFRLGGGGQTLSIQDPAQISAIDATILIMPYWYHDSIKKQIKEMGFKNKITSLMNHN